MLTIILIPWIPPGRSKFVVACGFGTPKWRSGVGAQEFRAHRREVRTVALGRPELAGLDHRRRVALPDSERGLRGHPGSGRHVSTHSPLAICLSWVGPLPVLGLHHLVGVEDGPVRGHLEVQIDAVRSPVAHVLEARSHLATREEETQEPEGDHEERGAADSANHGAWSGSDLRHAPSQRHSSPSDRPQSGQRRRTPLVTGARWASETPDQVTETQRFAPS